MYRITKLTYIWIVKYMNIYNQYLRRLPVNKIIKIVHTSKISNINLRFFGENSCKIYEEYGYYRADT